MNKLDEIKHELASEDCPEIVWFVETIELLVKYVKAAEGVFANCQGALSEQMVIDLLRGEGPAADLVNVRGALGLVRQPKE